MHQFFFIDKPATKIKTNAKTLVFCPSKEISHSLFFVVSSGSLCNMAALERAWLSAVYSSRNSFANRKSWLSVCILTRWKQKAKRLWSWPPQSHSNHGEESNTNSGGYGFPSNMSSSSIASSSEESLRGGGNKFIFPPCTHSHCTRPLFLYSPFLCRTVRVNVLYNVLISYYRHKEKADCSVHISSHICQLVYSFYSTSLYYVK